MSGAGSMPLKVLVADDAPSMRKLVCLTLEKEGFVTEQASDGVEAIEKLDAGGFDAAVIDLVMPRLDGIAVLDHIIRHMPRMLSKTVVVTAYPAIAMREQLHDVCEVLAKPHELSRLIEVVHGLVAKGMPAAS